MFVGDERPPSGYRSTYGLRVVRHVFRFCRPIPSDANNAIRVGPRLRSTPTVLTVEGDVRPTICLHRYLPNHAIVFGFRRVGNVLRLCSRVHAPRHAFRLTIRVRPRRARRRVGSNLMVLLHLILRVVKGKDGREAHAFRTTLCVSLAGVTGRKGSVGDATLAQRLGMDKRRKLSRAFARLPIKVNRPMRLRLKVVSLSHRMAALVWGKSEADCAFHQNVGLLIYDLRPLRLTRIGVHFLRRVGRRDEDTNERPRVLMLLYVGNVRRAREVMGVLAVLTRVVPIVLPLRVHANDFVHLTIHRDRPLGIQAGLIRRLPLNSTTCHTRIVPRASILRVVRLARSTRLTRLTSSHSGRRAGMLPRSLREARGLARFVPGLLLRKSIKVAIRGEDIMFIGRSGSQRANLFVHATSRALRADDEDLFLLFHPVGLFAAGWGRVRLFLRVRRNDVFDRARVGVRCQVRIPILFRALRNRPLGRVFFPLGMDLGNKRRRTFPGPPQATRGVRAIHIDRSMGRFNFICVCAVPIARLLGVLCACKMSSMVFFRVLVIFWFYL